MPRCADSPPPVTQRSCLSSVEPLRATRREEPAFLRLRRVEADPLAPSPARLEPLLRPRQVAQPLQQPLRDLLQAPEQLPHRLARLPRQPPQQAAALQQLHQDERDLQQQVVGLPLLRVDAVDVPQVQPAVLLAVEPLVLHLPAIPAPFLGYLLDRPAADRQARQPGEVALALRRRLGALQRVELEVAPRAVRPAQPPYPAERLVRAIGP